MAREVSEGQLTMIPVMDQITRTRAQEDGVALPPGQLRRRVGHVPKAPRNGQRWTDDEDAWLSRRYHEGADCYTIAVELARSTWAVSTRLYRLAEYRHDQCAQCGVDLPGPRAAGHPRIFCPTCRAARRLVPDAEPRTCQQCQQIFQPVAEVKENIYCSDACTNRAWYAKVREQREAARVRYGASGDTVTEAQAAEVRRLRTEGASWRYIEANVGVHRRAALLVLDLA